MMPSISRDDRWLDVDELAELEHIRLVRQRPPDFVTAPPGQDTGAAGEPVHEYLSTGCWHGDHDYCQSMTGYGGSKRPGRCKFCDARCTCSCHTGVAAG